MALQNAIYNFNDMNNLADPAKMSKSDQDDNTQHLFREMLKMVNVDCDDYGNVSLRKGKTLLTAGSGYHSGWANPYAPLEMYVVMGKSIKRFWPNGNLTDVVNGLTIEAPMAWIQVNDTVVYSNGVDIGMITNGIPQDPVEPPRQFLVPMPAGDFLEYYNGRLYTSKNGILYYSAPGAINWMDERQHEAAIFRDDIIMVQRVDTGLYVSTISETFYLHGDDPEIEVFQVRSVLPYSAIKNTNYPIRSEKLNLDGYSGWACFFATKRNTIIAGNNGVITEKATLVFPPSVAGAAIVREQDGLWHYLCSLVDVAGEAYNQYNQRSIDVDY